MRVKVKTIPKLVKGGGINNIANPIPYPSLFNVNPFGLIAANPTGTKDDNVTSSIKPIDKEDANIEAEKGEVLVKGDLSGLYKITGKKHSQGGTPIMAEGGSFIFSDDKSLYFNKDDKNIFNFKMGTSDTRKNNTPAKVLSREVNPQDYNKMMTILADPKSNDIAKQTATLMLQKYQQKIGQVALVQEAKKAGQFPSFAVGPTGLSTDQADMAKEGAEAMYAALGGLVRFDTGGYADTYPPDKTGKWAYDNKASKNPKTGVVSKDWNAMTSFDSPLDYAKAVGYTGKLNPTDPNSVRKLQQYVMQQYPDIVAKYHSPTQYGMPAEGRADDGKLGVRWDAIGRDISDNPKLNIPFKPLDSLAPPTAPSTTPTTPQPTAGPGMPLPIQDQWGGYKFGMNAQEKLTTAAPFLAALTQKPYYDMLVQKYTPNVRLDRMDPTQEVSDIQQASSLATREAAQNLPGRTSVAQGAAAQARATNSIDNIYHQINERNQQIGNQELNINESNKVNDNNFNLQQIQQTYRNNLLTEQRRGEQLANGAGASLNNGIAIQGRLDAMGSAATTAALPYVTGAKDANGNPLTYQGQDGRQHQQQGVPIGFGNNRNPIYNPMFGGLDSVGINQSAAGLANRNFNSLLMGQINDALGDKSVEGTKRLYTLLLGLDRTNKPNTKGDTPLEEIGQAASRAYYSR